VYYTQVQIRTQIIIKLKLIIINNNKEEKYAIRTCQN